jgi:hypothetical protein
LEVREAQVVSALLCRNTLDFEVIGVVLEAVLHLPNGVEQSCYFLLVYLVLVIEALLQFSQHPLDAPHFEFLGVFSLLAERSQGVEFALQLFELVLYHAILYMNAVRFILLMAVLVFAGAQAGVGIQKPCHVTHTSAQATPLRPTRC